MTTATGDFAIDFSGLGDVSPYTNVNFTVEGASTFKIESGALEPNTGGYTFFAYTDQATIGDVYVIKIETTFSNAGGNPAVAAVLDSFGDGYGLELNGSQTRMRRYESYGLVGGALNFDDVAYVSGDVFKLVFDESTGDLESFKNDVSYGTANNTQYTGTFRPGFLGTVNSNPSIAAIASLAIDNVGAAGPSITSTTDPAITGTAITIIGTGFGASQGLGSVKQEQGAEVETLSIVSWSDTSITATSATIESTSLKYGTQTLRVTDNAAAEDTTTFVANKSTNVDASNGWEDITSIATVGQLITAAGTLAISDQLAFDSVLTIQGGAATAFWFKGNADTTYAFDGATPNGTYEADVRAWDDTDQTWGTVGTQTIVVNQVLPTITGPTAPNAVELSALSLPYTITKREGQAPTLTGTDAGLFTINNVSGDAYTLDKTTDTGVATTVYNVTINIDNLVDTPVTQAVVITCVEASDVTSTKLSIGISIGI